MLTSLEISAIALVSVLGAVVSATLGWLESGEDFDTRKYAASVLRAVIAGLVFAYGFSTFEEATPWLYLAAFLGGAGVDVLGHRAAGTLRSE